MKEEIHFPNAPSYVQVYTLFGITAYHHFVLLQNKSVLLLANTPWALVFGQSWVRFEFSTTANVTWIVGDAYQPLAIEKDRFISVVEIATGL